MSDTPNDEGKRSEIGNLTEILRLQAETLARMTSRMGAAAPLAPPAARLPPGARFADDDEDDDATGNSTLPVLASDPSVSGESLPVLNTFRKFLADERRRARHRLTMVAVVFAVLLIVILTALIWAGRDRLQNMREELSRKQEQLQAGLKEGLREHEGQILEKNRQLTDDKVNQVAAATLRYGAALTNQTAKTQYEMRQDLDAQGMDLGRAKDTVSKLQIENADLGRQLQELRFRTEYLTDMLSNLVTRSAVPMSPLATMDSGTMQVTNANHTLRFRVPGGL